ncbi:amino acid adenylation domain-containing protein [Streptomyces sp. URMC 123]|uniref:amino acid adenylation domain-containing protein n=1 Tax=Streptomyces sp. URMC 123 TaxID=3423403 RepID=UPI003F1B09D7
MFADRLSAVPGGLPGLVAHHARRTPDALAVTDGDTALTYRLLVGAARRLAAELGARGVRPGDAVGLLTARSARTVVAQLALWWAGAACVPLDASHPRPRIAAMLADSGAELVLGDKEMLEVAAPAGTRTHVLSDETTAHPGDLGDLAADPAPYDAGATALVMFTSGSTGRPKGVAITHGGIAELFTAPDYLTITPRDRVLFHSAGTFDASTFEVWCALANGAAVVVSTADRPSLEELARDVERHGATVAFFTTALFHQLAARRSRLFGVLRTVVVGGEALAARPAREVLRAFPWLELINGYGPTETTTFATVHRVTDADCDAPPPIGRPVAGATAHVFDAAGEPVPAGAIGELWVGGSRLARGYMGLPETTAERFVDHPAHGRLYRTGDLVSARADGTLDFHGRCDDQVKVRGFRIEPGEVEHALRGQPEVADAAVAVRRPAPDDARLAAFVVPAPGPLPRPETLRARLAETLPPHLVPDEWTVVDRLPLTPAGKVDRRALVGETAPAEDGAGPAGSGTADGSGAADTSPASVVGVTPVDETTRAENEGAASADRSDEPDTDATPAAQGGLSPIEEAVADAWSRSLERPVTSADADFFPQGGHSLLALAVVDDLREDLGVELTLAEFFATPTVAGQARLVEQALIAEVGAGGHDRADATAATLEDSHAH